jgi:hypothetical protein
MRRKREEEKLDVLYGKLMDVLFRLPHAETPLSDDDDG